MAGITDCFKKMKCPVSIRTDIREAKKRHKNNNPDLSMQEATEEAILGLIETDTALRKSVVDQINKELTKSYPELINKNKQIVEPIKETLPDETADRSIEDINNEIKEYEAMLACITS